MKNIFKNKRVLVTGGTGSIGSAIVFELIKYGCKTIRVFSNDENGLHNLSMLLNNNENLNFIKSMKKNSIRYIYGDITDLNRIITATEDIDYVIHAAAMKHVPICEYNPFEATKVNVLGTENVVRASLTHKNVKKFILISTDKVVDATTVLGSSKLLAEKNVLTTNLNKGSRKLNLSVVRFGNVIGTRGSVLPKFISQIQKNENITLTDKSSTRFFVTVKEAVDCVISSMKMMKGGEIFIPKTIHSIKIYDLAISLKKFYPKSKSKINIIGLRDGEKVHEKIISLSEASKLKIYKNFYILDTLNKHKLKNLKMMFEYFESNKAKLLSQSKIISYLKKNNLLDQ